MENKSKSSAPALTKGLLILDIISQDKAVGFNELKHKTGYPSTTLSRLLKVLVENGYIQKDENSKYTLGLKILVMSKKDSFWNALINVAKEGMNYLNKTFGVTVLLVGFTNEQSVILHKVVAESNLAMLNVGKINNDLANFPWGILYLANQSKDVQEKLIEKTYDEKNCTMKVIPRKKIDIQLKQALTEGHVDDNAWYFDGRRFSAPIYVQNKMIASISTGTFKQKANEIDINKMINEMKTIANDISKKL